MAGRISMDMEHAVKLRAIHDSIRKSGLADAYRRTPYEKVFLEIVASVGRDMYLAVMRMLDSHHGSDRASIPRLIGELGKPAQWSEVMKLRSAILLGAVKRDPEALRHSITWRWREVEVAEAGLLEKLRDHRDQYLAHNLMLPAPDALLTREVYRAMRLMAPVVEDLCILLGADRPGFHLTTGIWLDRGRKFWKWLAAHPPPADAEGPLTRPTRSHTWRRPRQRTSP
jgi:hypothetical protein